MKWIETLNKRDALLLILSVIAFNRATSWLPKYYYIHPFPLFEIVDENGMAVGITLQSYFYIFCFHALMIAFWQYCKIKEPNRESLFYVFRSIEIMSLVDFFIIYEQPWFYMRSYGVEFTDFKIILYLFFYVKWTVQQY